MSEVLCRHPVTMALAIGPLRFQSHVFMGVDR